MANLIDHVEENKPFHFYDTHAHAFKLWQEK